MVNVINNGYIDNVSSGIIVELPTYIDEFGLHPQKIGKPSGCDCSTVRSPWERISVNGRSGGNM